MPTRFRLRVTGVILGFEGVVAKDGKSFEDVLTLFDVKDQMGLRLAVISRFSQAKIKAALGSLFPNFDAIVERVLDDKKGENMNQICVDWKVSPEEVVFISHRDSSIRQARKFSLRPIGLTRGKHHGDPEVHALANNLMNKGASSTIIDLAEFRTWMRLKAVGGDKLLSV